VRFALMIEPQQGLSYEEQLAVARRAEAAGFEALFRSDHYESFPGDSDQPTTDAWAVLAGLARETTTLGLGVLVSPVLFRTPGNLAKVALTVDEMSGGRIEVGLGAGWHEAEHRRHGFPFPEIKERADHLEEALEILHGLWDEPDGWSFLGRHYAVEDARMRPKAGSIPGREAGRPPIIIGGEGSPRSYRLAARFADEFNLSSSSPELATSKFAELDETLRASGRDPGTITHSAMVGVLIGRNEEELQRRESDLLDAFGEPNAGADWFEARRARWIHGTPDEARAMAARFADAGAERLMLQDFIARDLDMIDLAGEVLIG
jgi:F420-dependent oxidoreductase-like protein